MDALTLLKKQHDEVDDLFERYENANDGRAKRAIVNEIADKLAAHATIEEKLFYPAVYVGELKDLLREAVEEHLAAKRLIADLIAMSATEENYDAKVKVLKEQIEHHVEEEEDKLFPKVKKTFDARSLDALGEEMESAFAELLKQSPRERVPEETDEAAPLH